MDDRTALRRRDFWTALILIAASLFFLYRTAQIPFFKADAAGVDAGKWYNSAALVPYGIFAAILLLSTALLVVAIRQGGLPRSGTIGAVAGWLTGAAGTRMIAAATIMLAYIFALVPRVDFTIASALVLLALIYGFHCVRGRATAAALLAVLLPAAYALAANFPQSAWNAPHDDDWISLGAFVCLTMFMVVEARAADGRLDPYLRAAPFIAVLVPLFLVLVMAFGFRQNVPNRTGLVFQQIEYHYYVNLRPWLAGRASD